MWYKAPADALPSTPYAKKCSRYGKINHFKAVCRSTQRQRQGHRSLQRTKVVHEVQQDEESYTRELRNNGRNVD